MNLLSLIGISSIQCSCSTGYISETVWSIRGRLSKHQHCLSSELSTYSAGAEYHHDSDHN